MSTSTSSGPITGSATSSSTSDSGGPKALHNTAFKKIPREGKAPDGAMREPDWKTVTGWEFDSFDCLVREQEV